MAAPSAASLLKRSRIATAVFFGINGVLAFSLLPRLGEIQLNAGLDDAGLGVVLAVGTAGGLIVGPLAAIAVQRFGATTVSAVMALVSLPAVIAIGFASSGVMLAAAFAGYLAADAVMDAAMNTRALQVQGDFGRSIINSFHGWWSLATIIGSALGALSAVLGIALPAFLIGLSVAAGAFAGVAWAWDPGPLGAAQPGAASQRLRPETIRTMLRGGLAALALFIILAVIVEDVPVRWGAIYLSDLGQSAAVIGLAYVLLTSMQTLGRFMGDRLVDRYGQTLVIRWSMITVAIAMGVALIQGSAFAFVIASGVSGLGVATLFPAAMHAAAQLPGVSAAIGIAFVSWFSRVGFVLAPLLVGLLADGLGIQYGLGVMVIAALGLVVMARRIR